MISEYIGAFGPVILPTQLPFGTSQETVAYVSLKINVIVSMIILCYYILYQFNSQQISSTGLISFGTPFLSFFPLNFPIGLHVIAPFWEPGDLRIRGGSIQFALIGSSHPTFSELLPVISEFISTREETDFDATWMAVVRWVDTCPDFFLTRQICNGVSIHA